MSKRILVTGGAGFIGSNLVRFLINETAHQVLVVDKLTFGNVGSLADVQDSARFALAQLDICDREPVDDAITQFEPTSIVHLAAESHVDRSIDEPNQFIQTNLVGTFVLLQAARRYLDLLPPSKRADFRFVHVSTDEVYGSLENQDSAFTETTRYDPHSPYSASKAGSDHLARAWYYTYGLPVIVTNCSNNYGPFQFPEKLIPVVILKAIRGEPIPVYGTGENIRDWLYVVDHVRALDRVLSNGTPGETYNIGGDNECRNLDLVRLICNILDEFLPCEQNEDLLQGDTDKISSYCQLITFVADRPGHDRRYAIDASKMRGELGWVPREELESGFRKTVAWYLENRSWWQRILTDEYRLERLGLGRNREEPKP